MTNSYLLRIIKGFFTHPSIEFCTIAKENPGIYTIVKRIIIPLSGIFISATFLKGILKYFTSGSSGQILSVILSSIVFSGIALLLLALQILLGTLLIYGLANPFKTEQSMTASFSVMVFSFILYFLSSILDVIPGIGIYLTIPALIYCCILLYWGVRYILKPPDKLLDGYYFSILTGLLLISMFTRFILHIIS